MVLGRHPAALKRAQSSPSMFVFSRSAKFIDRASNSSNLLVQTVFRDSSVVVYSFAGLNSVFGSQYLPSLP